MFLIDNNTEGRQLLNFETICLKTHVVGNYSSCTLVLNLVLLTRSFLSLLIVCGIHTNQLLY